VQLFYDFLGVYVPDFGLATTMAKPNQSLPRTQFAERHVEELLSIPFISEFVFRSPQTTDATQREVADMLIAHGSIGILISQKCQEDPSSRDVAKTESWARKKAQEAFWQLRGALRTATGKAVWCDHPRRGRVQFPNGLPKIDHGIVLVEVFQPIDLKPEVAALALDFQGTPISYLSVNDFLNLALELRTTPELIEYLNVRRSLPSADLRVIGDEKSLFEFYLLNGGSLQGCASRTVARKATAARQDELRRLLKLKAESDRYSKLLEHVADQLATRNPAYAENISAAALAGFEPASSRTGYLEMQGVFANLRLRERAELGREFHGVIDQLTSEPEGFAYNAAYLDSKPEWVFVFGSCKNVERAILLDRMMELMWGAMAFYGRERCLTVVDRDGGAYEVVFGHMKTSPTFEERQVGKRRFGHLRIVDRPASPIPQV
jgi:hypothetical protein